MKVGHRTRNFVLAIAAAMSLWCFSGCRAMEVDSQRDPSWTPRAMTQWAWHPESGTLSGDLHMKPSEVEGWIQEAVEGEMEARGFERVLREEADFWVSYHGRVDVEDHDSTVDDEGGLDEERWLSGRAFSGEYTDTFTREEGTLVLAVSLPSDRCVWRGWAQTELQRTAPLAERKERLRLAVGEILDAFEDETR